MKISKDKRELFRVWSLYVLYTCTTLCWSINRTESLNHFFGMLLLYILSFIFFSSAIDPNSLKIIDRCWLIVTVVLIMIVLFGNTNMLGYTQRQTLILLGTETDANEFGSFFIISGPIAFKNILYSEKMQIRVVNGLIILMSVYTIFLTGSRGALLSYIIALLLFISKNINIKKAVIIGLIVFILVGVISVFLLPHISGAVLERYMLSTMMADGGSGRTDIWRGAIENFINADILRILFGNGYCRYPVNYFSRMMIHNQFLQQLISFGIVGLAIYIVFFLQCARIYKNSMLSVYNGAFWGMFVMSMTITMGPSYKILWYIFFMAMMAEKKR